MANPTSAGTALPHSTSCGKKPDVCSEENIFFLLQKKFSLLQKDFSLLEKELFLPERDAEWLRFDEIVSTSTFLRTYERTSRTLPYVVAIAQFQTAGRGQRGNSWESEAGKNLLFSIAHYAPPVAPKDQFFISELISCSILAVLTDLFPTHKEHFRIKWPNDIYWKDRKLAGILIEHELSENHILKTIIGIGINVNQRAFLSDAPNPVSLLQATGEETAEPENILQRILACYANVINQYRDAPSPWATLIGEAYHSVLYRRGTKASYRDAQGIFQAVLERVEPDGMLCLRDDRQNLRRYAFKEVVYLI